MTKHAYDTPEDKAKVDGILAGLDHNKNKHIVDIIKVNNNRTPSQNASLHKYLTITCDKLNAGGYTYRKVMNRRGVEYCEKAISAINKYTMPVAVKVYVLGWIEGIQTLLLHADMSWTMDLVKNCLWRPVQLALTEKESSADLTTVEIQTVYLEFNNFMSEVFYISTAWPSKESMSEDQR